MATSTPVADPLFEWAELPELPKPPTRMPPHGPHLHDLKLEEVARHLRAHPSRPATARYERWLKSHGRHGDRDRFRRLMRAYFLPDDATNVEADAAGIHMAALALKDADKAEVDAYYARIDPKEARYVRQVIADPNPPPDDSSGLGDWAELQAWSRMEPMLTAYVGFSTAPWYGVVNRKAVRRQYQVLTARVGGKSFWASSWVYPLVAAIGMGLMLVIGLIALMVVDDKQISYKVVNGEPVAVIGHWFNWWWVLGLMLGVGAPMSLGGWPITLWSMWRVAFADVYALQLHTQGTRLKYKLKFKTAILNHAANSQAFGGSTIRGGGLKGGYAVHITRQDLMNMPARKVLDLPLRGGNAPTVADWLETADDEDNLPESLRLQSGDAIETLMADGDHLFDGAQARTTAADGSTVQKAGEIKLQWAKKKQGRQLPVSEIGGWIIILIMVIAIFIQLQSGFTVTDTVTGAF